MTRSFATMLVVVLATLALEAGPYAAGRTSSAALEPTSREAFASKTESGKTVAFWNLTGINTILATPLGPRAAPLGSRAMAMMHVALADAVASIHPTYKPYAVRVTGHGSSDEVAAAAAAAYGVLGDLPAHIFTQLGVAESSRYNNDQENTIVSPLRVC